MTNLLKQSLRQLIRWPVYKYRRRCDLAISPLPTHNALAARLGASGVNSALDFPAKWLGETDRLFGTAELTNETFTGNIKYADLSLKGIFDVLGSGEVRSGSQLDAKGAFGHKYERQSLDQDFQLRAQQILAELDSASNFLDDASPQTSNLVDAISNGDYTMVDWHTDVKSGYRWDPSGWWLDQAIGPAPGVDIKVPWEISRGHDLVDLAIAGNVEPSVNYHKTLSIRLLDWIAANPARKGVNWRSTMEVAIRATNWIWALSIANAAESLSPSVIWIVARSLEQHAHFIIKYPDEGGAQANNHYIADMAGLAHIAAALPTHEDAPIWAEIAAGGLAEQASAAVDSGGFSVEGSVGYHRFVTELLTHGTLATLRFPHTWAASRITDQQSHWRSIAKVFTYADFIKKPNDRSPQFGDHDAGRYLKFSRPLSEAGEDTLNHSHLAHLAQGIANTSADHDENVNPESLLPTLGINRDQLSEAQAAFRDEDETTSQTIVRSGVWLSQTERLWVAVRTFEPVQSDPTGHLHDDALTVELSVDGHDVLVDPGTGVYTSDATVRNQLRARHHHSTAGPSESRGNEQADLFQLSSIGKIDVLKSNSDSLSATYRWDDWTLTRSVDTGNAQLVIEDNFDSNQPWQQVFIFHPDVSVNVIESNDQNTVKLNLADIEIMMHTNAPGAHISVDVADYSPHYGTLVPTQRLVVSHSGSGSSEIHFEID